MDFKNLNNDPTADEFLRDLLSLSEEQNKLYIDHVDEFSPSELFDLNSPIEPNRHRDFIGNLPLEIVEKIVYHMDLTAFINCIMVCKNWYAIISPNSRLWQVACQKLGLSVERPHFPDVMPDYKNRFLRMRNRFKKMKNGEASFDTESIESATCLHYHKGIVAIAIANKMIINLWRVKPHLEFLLKIDTTTSVNLTCLHFDDSFLVAGTENGHLLVWKSPAAKMLYSRMHMRQVSSVTFNTDIDLLITVANRVTFLCLSTGQVLCSFDVDKWTGWYSYYQITLQIHLVHIPMLQNGHDYMFIYHTTNRLYAYSFDSKCIPSTCKSIHLNQIDLGQYPYVVLPSVHVSGCFLYFMSSSPLSPTSILYKWDISNGVMTHEIEIMGHYVKLVGVGKKYACLLESPSQKQMQNVVIYDITTETHFATVAIPNSSKQLDKLLQLGDLSWLDGFDGLNDNGVFLIRQCKSNVINIVKWFK